MRYSERLVASVGWWAFAAIVVASMWIAFGAAVGAVGGALAGLVTAVVLFGALTTYGAARITVDARRLNAGPATIERRYLGPATALDAEQTGLRRGPQADPRAWLLIRPYISGSVMVEVRDGSDPAPYWLISSRRPAALATALNSTPND